MPARRRRRRSGNRTQERRQEETQPWRVVENKKSRSRRQAQARPQWQRRAQPEEKSDEALPPVPSRTLEQFQESWKRYESIEGLWKEDNIESIRENGHANEDVEWVITEKIHGANFGFITNGKHVLATRRSSVLEPGTKFFLGWEAVLQKQRRKALRIFRHIRRNVNPDVEVITIFGELFGGYYEHPEIEVPETVGQVQFGLSYSPDLHFCAFDIRVDTTFLDYDDAHAICTRMKMMFAEPLARGVFDECIQFDVETFETRVPDLLNLPPPVTRHGEPNIGEGVVIRRAQGGHVMIKKKAKKFYEFCRKGGVEAGRRKKEMAALVGEECFEFALSCLTEMRFDGAVSKIGEITSENSQQIVAEFAEDVMRDIVRAHQSLRRLHSTDLKKFQGYMKEEAERFGVNCVKRRRKQRRLAQEESA